MPVCIGHLAQEEAGAAHVEEGQIAVGEEVRQPQLVTVERLAGGDVAHQERHLAEAGEGERVGLHRVLLRVSCREAGPVAKL